MNNEYVSELNNEPKSVNNKILDLWAITLDSEAITNYINLLIAKEAYCSQE